jgi:hypothetical protein
MIRYYKFRQDLFGPTPAREIYVKPGPGRGWPQECPPIRAACAFGYDILANFDLTFLRQRDGTWKVKDDVVISSDFDWAPPDAPDDSEQPGRPLTQQYAWFWERGQKIPHPITDNVYAEIKNQVKVSSFLYLATDPNELLFFTDIPNLIRPYKAMTALVEADWYPASYPWHVVLELDPKRKRIDITRGDPLCRVIPVRRDTYFAQQMTPDAFDAFFARGQAWLSTHGKFEHEAAGEGTADITRTYVKQRMLSKFVDLG